MNVATQTTTLFVILRRGSTGDEVKVVQARLAQLGYEVIVDGIFGTQTEKAIETLQQERSLSIDGIVGPLTWKALIPPILRRGSAGKDVEYLQTILRGMGHPVAADGIFGSHTHEAIEKFQQERNLRVDGIVGLLTWKALLCDPVVIGE